MSICDELLATKFKSTSQSLATTLPCFVLLVSQPSEMILFVYGFIDCYPEWTLSPSYLIPAMSSTRKVVPGTLLNSFIVVLVYHLKKLNYS